MTIYEGLTLFGLMIGAVFVIWSFFIQNKEEKQEVFEEKKLIITEEDKQTPLVAYEAIIEPEVKPSPLEEDNTFISKAFITAGISDL